MTVSAQDAHEYPIYNARFRAIFPLLDADGDLVTGATTPDSEISQDQGTFADATNEMTEIGASSGVYYLDLVAGEMDTKSTTIIAKSATAGMKTTVLVLHPRRLPVVRTGTAQAGAASTITLDSGASAIDDFYNGCWVNITNNSPANAQGQARKITDYVGSTKVATIEGTWGTNPSSASTFEVLANPESANTVQWAGTTIEDPATAGRPDVSVADMQANVVTASAIATAAIDADAIATDAIGAAEIADGAITAATFAAGAIDAAAIANAAIDAATFAAGAIDGAALAADAGTEIAAAVWNEDATGHQTQGTFGQAIGDPVADANTIFKAVVTDAAGATVGVDVVAVQADTDDIQARLPAALVSGRMSADAVAISGDTVAADNLEAEFDGTGYLSYLRRNTAQAGAAGTITLDSGASASDDFYNGKILAILSGTGAGQARMIQDYVGATKVATITPNWVTNPDATSVFVVFPGGPADVVAWSQAVVNALVAGRVDSSVGAMAANVVTAAAIATDAIGADEFAQGAADKVWSSGTRTLTAFSTALALSVWDVLETAIVTASSIGLKLKNNLDAAVTSRATPAQVNTEVLNVLNTDTFAEPGQGAPPATTTLVQKLGYLYKAFRNRNTQTASQYSLYNDDAVTVDQKATVSDDGTTFDRTEVISGP